MTDRLTAEQRSENMRRIRGAHTKPELTVRKLLHRMGLRFRLHRRDLPGHPDIVMPGRRVVIFVHGCYWHRHVLCRKGNSVPTANREFWLNKFRQNQARDLLTQQALQALGWRVLVVWECETVTARALGELTQRLRETLRAPEGSSARAAENPAGLRHE